MSIRALTDSPAALLARIKQLIDQEQITSWDFDDDGDFTCTIPDFEGQAWFHPQVQEKKLRFSLLPTQGPPLTPELYAAYHGRLIEMLLIHVSEYFTIVCASPKPAVDEPTFVAQSAAGAVHRSK